MASFQVVLYQNVDMRIGTHIQKVRIGMAGLVATHSLKVSMCAQYRPGILEIEAGDKFAPRYGVKQATTEQFAASRAVRQVFM